MGSYTKALRSGTWGSIHNLGNASRLEAAIAMLRAKWPPDHPIDDHRNLNKAEELLRLYAAEYPGENFEVLQVEVPIHPRPGASAPSVSTMLLRQRRWDWISREDCGSCGAELEVIEYGGIMDLTTSFGPVLYTMDHKTTSELGTLFFRQFETSNQMTGYCWGLNKLSSKRVAGANINALCTTRGGRISFARATTNRSEADFETWRRSVQVECGGLARNLATGIFPHRSRTLPHEVRALPLPRSLYPGDARGANEGIGDVLRTAPLGSRTPGRSAVVEWRVSSLTSQSSAWSSGLSPRPTH